MSIRKVQLGAESTAGTAVAGTEIYRAPASDIVDGRVQVNPQEDIGYFGGTDRRYEAAQMASMNFPDHEATFEQIGYHLNAGIEYQAGVQDGAGSGYVRTYDVPTSAENTLKTYTVYGRNTTQPARMPYGFVKSFTLTGTPQAAWTLSAEWAGRYAETDGVSFASLSLTTVEEMLFGKSKLYIDAIDGTIGTTQKTGTWLGATLNVVTGWDWLFTGDGNTYPYRAKFYPALLAVTGSVTFEYDATAIAQRTAFENRTAQQMRWLIEGSTLGTSGTAYSKKTQIIDMAFKWTSFPEIGEQDKNDIITAEFECKYNATADFRTQFINVNERSSL